MTEPQKDTIYIDIDDEITSIIDKTRSSDKKIVALVLPKRATVLQSIVNMKLLKHTAEADAKKIVLITSEAGLLPVACSVGLHVTKTLESKPEIPPPPDMHLSAETAVDEDISETPEAKTDRAKNVSELAGSAAVKAQAKEETIELDNSDTKDESQDDDKPKAEKPKVPNFDRFRKRLLLGGLALLALIFLWIFAFKSLPKATIIIKTDASTQDVSSDITLDTDVKTLSANSGLVPAQSKELKKSDSQSAPATGQKDVGTKASGTISIENCEDSSSHTFSSGTKFTSSGGKVFQSKRSFTVPAGGIEGG